MKRQIIGCGFSCIDIIKYDEKIVTDIGGTCANVLSILNCLNWETEIWIPKYEETFFKTYLSNRGILCNEFANTRKKVPKILQVDDKETKQHVFLTRCPKCGNRFAECVLPTVKQVERGYHNTAMLFFCDRISEGISRLAEITKENNGYTMYEPNGFRIYEQFIKNCKKFDIVKFSEEKLSERQKNSVLDDLQESTVRLVIMTKGQLGLRFAFRNGSNRLSRWNHIEAIRTDKLKDSSGAGDWLTAVFLNSFFSWDHYTDQFENYEFIKSCLYKGMQIAALSCGYIGAQGALRDKKLFEVIGSWTQSALDQLDNEDIILENFKCMSCGTYMM